LPDKSAGGKVFSPNEADSNFICDIGFCVLHCFRSDARTGNGEASWRDPKIDEQNAKIDALSQEILKLEQEISHIRPGVMIGESTPVLSNSAASTMSPLHPVTAGNTHIVARGETLTSIAKMYKVTIDELQKANHIEDGRKLQAGQTISIPTSATPTPTPAG
jgi:LysM repeat protein